MKVLVFGGSGVTGRAVVRYLRADVPGLDLAYSARRPDSRVGVRYVHVDFLGDRSANVATLAGFDWVIVCVGPFEVIGDRVHAMCIEAGTHCIDVNDSIDARRLIVARDASARDAGVTVLTGCGLCPGLSTIVLASAATSGNVNPAEVTAVDSTLIVGAGQEPGAAAIRSMLATLGSPYRVLRDGLERKLPPTVEPGGRCGSQKAPYFVGYECPDLDIAVKIFPNIQTYDYRICFEQLQSKNVRRLQRSTLLRSEQVKARLAPVVARIMARRLHRRTTIATNAVLSITVTDRQTRSAQLSLTGASSYELTGMCAAAVLGEIVVGGITPHAGVHEMSDLTTAHPAICAAVKRHGVSLVTHPPMLGDHNLPCPER